MTDSLTGSTDEGELIVGGYPDSVDASISSRASQASVDVIDGIVDSILVDTDATIPGLLSAISAAIAVIDANVDAILTDTGTDIPAILATISAAVNAIGALVVALNNLSTSDVTSVLDAQGLTAVRAALLDNLDAAISSRESESSASTRAATDQASHGTTQAAIAALPAAPSAASVATAVLTATTAGRGAGSVGEALEVSKANDGARREISIGNGSTDTWTETVYVYDPAGPPDSVVLDTFELYDQDGDPINGNDAAGNNPLADPTRIIVGRVRV